ncbi:MAG: hypothetical protein LBP94_00850 [Zoogloeaceae bacterium]|jgi:hypothetical protein|nr:hypothetical protein [Zoogloeaceae bacterium]
MTTETDDNTEAPQGVELPPAASPVQQERAFDPRRRLRELLSVPERDRTDAQWDEINELEIQLAPGNRIPPGLQPGSIDKPVGAGRQFQQKKHPAKGTGGRRRPRPPGNNPNKPQQQ